MYNLIGEILTHIDTNGNDEIVLTTQSGRRIKIYHSQNCCETVCIEDTVGDFEQLLFKPLISITHEEECSNDQEYYESCTKTDITFKVNDATVISKWIGTSNGYYSESVHWEELKPLFNN